MARFKHDISDFIWSGHGQYVAGLWPTQSNNGKICYKSFNSISRKAWEVQTVAAQVESSISFNTAGGSAFHFCMQSTCFYLYFIVYFPLSSFLFPSGKQFFFQDCAAMTSRISECSWFWVHVVDVERKGGASFALVRRQQDFSLDLVYHKRKTGGGRITVASSLHEIFADQLRKRVVVRG